MFQNLVMSGLVPLSNTNEIHSWDNRPFTGKWPENQSSAVKGSEIKRPIKKKPKRNRTAYSTNQIRALEEIYATSKYIDAKRRKQLAETLNIGDKALKIWFQNRRMKEKKESSDSSCDTSSELATCQSPALKNYCTEKKEKVNIPFPNFSECYEPAQYQFPAYYYHNGTSGQHYQHEYWYEPNRTGFDVDTSVYPTQYYPVDNQYNIDGNANCQAENAYGTDGWYSQPYDSSYLTAQWPYFA